MVLARVPAEKLTALFIPRKCILRITLRQGRGVEMEVGVAEGRGKDEAMDLYPDKKNY